LYGNESTVGARGVIAIALGCDRFAITLTFDSPRSRSSAGAIETEYKPSDRLWLHHNLMKK
jgi:hypothetical protein